MIEIQFTPSSCSRSSDSSEAGDPYRTSSVRLYAQA
jgi:hypothetical protein